MRSSIYKTNTIRIIFLLSVLLVVGYFFSPKNYDGIARAGAGDALSGYAWSENIGWISFNCTNNNSCGTSGNYGVNVSGTNLSGYAWSENVGWITFNSAELSGCPTGTCSATINRSTGALAGWAKALSASGGWDGWIKLAGTAVNGTQYGAVFSGLTASGYSWGGDVIGWIKWNGSNYGVTSTINLTNQAPTTSIFSPGSDITIYDDQSQLFTGEASDPDGTITAYEWRTGNCSTGTLLSSSISFSQVFSVGTYVIYFRAQDNGGSWSTNCPSRTVTVIVHPPSPGVCGSANGVPTQIKPSTNLCNTAWPPAPVVLPDSNLAPSWSWTCSGQYGGANASCGTVTSCGNGVCEPKKGETPATCKADCKTKVIEF